MDWAHAIGSITHQERPALGGHIVEHPHIRKVATGADDAVLHGRLLQGLHHLLVGLRDGQVADMLRTLHRYVSKSLYPSSLRQVDEGLVALVVHLLKGETVALAGNTHAGEHQVYVIHCPGQGIGLGEFTEEHLVVIIVGQPGSSERPALAQTLLAAREHTHEIALLLKSFYNILAQIAGGACYQHPPQIGLRHVRPLN